MKKWLLLLALIVVPQFSAAAIGELTLVATDNMERQGRYIVVEPGEEIDVSVSLPVEGGALLLHRIPDGFSAFTVREMPSECSVLKKRDRTSPTNFRPFLVKCQGGMDDILFSYTATAARPDAFPRQTSSFTTGFYIDRFKQKYTFFEKTHFRIVKSVGSKTDSQKDDVDEPSDASDTGGSGQEDKNGASNNGRASSGDKNGKKVIIDFPVRERVVPNPASKILTENVNNTPVAAFEFRPADEPVIIRELMVMIINVDTSALYPDVSNDYEVIENVSLWYQDGTSVKTTDGRAAITSAIDSEGKTHFRGLDAFIPEAGEDIFVAVSIADLQEGQSGSAFSIRLSPDAIDSDFRGYWSQNRYSSDDVNMQDDGSPVFYVLADKLLAEKSASQPQTLLSGRNELLKIDLQTAGNDEVYLREIEAEITRSSGPGAGGFEVKTLRLRQAGNILASLAGADLVGTQTLVIGECAAGDVCETNQNRYEISQKRTFVLEAEIDPTGGGLSGTNFLNARIAVNGSAPGSDGIIWEDHGTGNDDGALMQWVLTAGRSTSYFENVIRTP